MKDWLLRYKWVFIFLAALGAVLLYAELSIRAEHGKAQKQIEETRRLDEEQAEQLYILRHELGRIKKQTGAPARIDRSQVQVDEELRRRGLIK